MIIFYEDTGITGLFLFFEEDTDEADPQTTLTIGNVGA